MTYKSFNGTETLKSKCAVIFSYILFNCYDLNLKLISI